MNQDAKNKTLKLYTCDLCSKHKAIVDGKTRVGPWAYMCKRCFNKWGIGLGLGKGQLLEQQNNNISKETNNDEGIRHCSSPLP